MVPKIGDIVVFCFEHYTGTGESRVVEIRERPAIVLSGQCQTLDLHVFYRADDYPSMVGTDAGKRAWLSQERVERGPPAPAGYTFWWHPRPGQEEWT